MIYAEERWRLKCQVSNYKHVNKKKKDKSRPCTEDYKGWKASCQTNNLYLWERWASIAGILCARKQKIIWLSLTIRVESRCISGELNSSNKKCHSASYDDISFPNVQFKKNKNAAKMRRNYWRRLCKKTASKDFIGNLVLFTILKTLIFAGKLELIYTM